MKNMTFVYKEKKKEKSSPCHLHLKMKKLSFPGKNKVDLNTLSVFMSIIPPFNK